MYILILRPNSMDSLDCVINSKRLELERFCCTQLVLNSINNTTLPLVHPTQACIIQALRNVYMNKVRVGCYSGSFASIN